MFRMTNTVNRCREFVRYEGSMTVIGINVTALMMLLRVYAMYEKKKTVLFFCTTIFAVEFSMNAWLLTYGVGTSMLRVVPKSLVLNLGFRSTTISRATFKSQRYTGYGSIPLQCPRALW